MPETPQPNSRTMPVGKSLPEPPLPMEARAPRSYQAAQPLTDRSEIRKVGYRTHQFLSPPAVGTEVVLNVSGKAFLVTSNGDFSSGSSSVQPGTLGVATDDNSEYIPVPIGVSDWDDGASQYQTTKQTQWYCVLAFSKLRITSLSLCEFPFYVTVFEEDVQFRGT